MNSSESRVFGSAVRRSNLRAAIVFGVVLAYGIGLWMVLLRHFQGGHQHGGPSLLIHWLGASTLALPAVLAAVAPALTLSRSLAPRGASQLLRQAVAAGAAAPAAALAYAASFPFREWLFGVTEADALPPPVRIARDTLLALALALPLATLGASLVLNERSARTWRVSRLRVLGIACGAFLAAAALGGSVRAADPGPGAPCPTGAPLKSFDVQAINVDITLNRFGDHDPTGKMYVLSSRVAAVRAQETAPLPNRVSIGLREDANPTARGACERGRLRRDQLHEQRIGRSIRRAHRRALLRIRVVG